MQIINQVEKNCNDHISLMNVRITDTTMLNLLLSQNYCMQAKQVLSRKSDLRKTQSAIIKLF